MSPRREKGIKSRSNDMQACLGMFRFFLGRGFIHWSRGIEKGGGKVVVCGRLL